MRLFFKFMIISFCFVVLQDPILHAQKDAIDPSVDAIEQQASIIKEPIVLPKNPTEDISTSKDVVRDSKQLIEELCNHLKKDSQLTFTFGLPGMFSASVPWSEVRNNPLSSVSIFTVLIAGAYCTKMYWYDPIIELLSGHEAVGSDQNSPSGKDAMADFTKSRARIYKPGDIKTKLKDVAGLQAAKLDVFDIMQFLKNPKAYTDMGAKIPKGVLMQGPPGNGKTLLAKAIAGEVDCPFISVAASEFVEMFVGAGAARIRDLFAKAKELAPCILFIDEFDAIAKKRSAVSFGGSDEQAQTLGQLLTLMDGFDMQKHPIIILAATNRAEVLDPAVIRPGRFDRIVEVNKPFLNDRIEILKVHLKHVKTAPKIDVPLIARATMGFSGAELANLVNEAAIVAVNDKSSCVDMTHIDKAYDNITLGRETMGMDLVDGDMWETAVHEAGHSIAAVFLEHADPLYKVTITPRGGALGISYQLPLREKYSSSEIQMKAKIITLLAGGLAEQEFGFGKKVGLSNDLKVARNIAYSMVAFYGMAEDLRYMSYADIDHNLPNDIATNIHHQVQKIIDECYVKAQELVHTYRPQIEQLANLLMEHGTVFGNVVYRMCGMPEPTIDYGLSS